MIGFGLSVVPSRNAYSVCTAVSARSFSCSSLPVPTNTQRSTPLAMSISICGAVVTGCAAPDGEVSVAIFSTFQLPESASETSKRQKLPSRSPA